LSFEYVLQTEWINMAAKYPEDMLEDKDGVGYGNSDRGITLFGMGGYHLNCLSICTLLAHLSFSDRLSCVVNFSRFELLLRND